MIDELVRFFEKTCPNCEHHWFDAPVVWLLIGFGGQLVFAARFIVQWIVSEKRKQSVIPVAFWYLSIAGSLMALAYAFSRRDPVFIMAYLFNSIVYLRNLTLIARRGDSLSPMAVPSSGSEK